MLQTPDGIDRGVREGHRDQESRHLIQKSPQDIAGDAPRCKFGILSFNACLLRCQLGDDEQTKKLSERMIPDGIKDSAKPRNYEW